MKIAKYILIFLLLVVPVRELHAARQVQGTVPDVQPLQPPAINTYPNLQNNIQAGQPVPVDQEPQQEDSPTELTQQQPSSPEVQKPKVSNFRLIVWLLVIIVAVVGGWWWFHRKSGMV